MTILIVDDEPVTRKGIISNIKWEKYSIDTVFEAGSGQEALSIASCNTIDIVISDIRMPNLNGLELIDRLLKKHNPQIIFISAYSEKEYLKSAIKFHAVGYIEKPVNLAELEKAVNEASLAVINGSGAGKVPALKNNEWEYLKRRSNYFWQSGDHLLSGSIPDMSTYVNELIRAIIQDDETAFDKAVNHITDKLKSNKDIDETCARAVFQKLCTMIVDFFKLSGAKTEETELFHPDNIDEMETIKDCCSFVLNIYHSLIGSIQDTPESQLFTAKVNLIIEHNYQYSGLYIPYICKILLVSKSKLCKLYKEETGMTINESIVKYRLNRACELIGDRKLPISEISSRTGFSDQNYFTRVFKHVFGITPSSYQAGVER